MSTPVTSASSTHPPSLDRDDAAHGRFLTMAALATDVMLPALRRWRGARRIQRRDPAVMTVFMIGYARLTSSSVQPLVSTAAGRFLIGLSSTP